MIALDDTDERIIELLRADGRIPFRAMAAELEKSRQQIDQLSGSLEDARRASRTDGLTRLANRRAFDDSLNSCRSNPTWTVSNSASDG